METRIKYYKTKLLLNEFNTQYPLFPLKIIANEIGINFSYSNEFPNVIQHLPNDEDYNAIICSIYKSIDATYSPHNGSGVNCFLNIMIYIKKSYIINIFGRNSEFLTPDYDIKVDMIAYFQKKWLAISDKWLMNLEINLFSTRIPEAYIKSWVYQYLYELAHEYYITLYPAIDDNFRQEDILKIKEMEILISNTSFNAMPSINVMAENVGMSPTKFKKIFKQAFGKSTHQYILDIKADQAKKLIATNKFTISQVAYKLGFNHPSSLTRLIKNKYNASPLKIGAKGFQSI